MRIKGINITDNKRLEVALTYLYGIGRTTAIKILKEASVDINKKGKDLTQEEFNKIKDLVEKNKIEGDLRRKISADIKRMKDIRCYKGTRHSRKLPVRGQRTKTNSRTVRGNVRITMTSGKRKMEKK